MIFEKDWNDICPKIQDMGARVWGTEEILAISSQNIMMKKLFIKARSKGGLQYHRKRIEAGYIVSGKMIVRLGKENKIEERILHAGDHFIFEQGVVHQEEALEDTVIIECSTPWINDRVRVEERYGIEKSEGLQSTSPGDEILL
jgi:mannose-6-phosphate isomerase